jgi:triosephosphate isomerase
MSRKPIIAGNWKMHCTREEARTLAQGVLDLVRDALPSTEVVLCPPFTALDVVNDVIHGSGIGLGAQNVHFESKGAFTGEVTVPMLKECGVSHIIVGHSERRQYFNETDQAINAKTKVILAHGLTPIVCVGETLAEREARKTLDVVSTQVNSCLQGLPSADLVRVVVAYEPVWAIGTGLTATKEQAQQVHEVIRDVLRELGGADTAETIRIQYGGSVKPDNAAELMGQPDIDGALVGGASLKATDFAAIVKNRH